MDDTVAAANTAVKRSFSRNLGGLFRTVVRANETVSANAEPGDAATTPAAGES